MVDARALEKCGLRTLAAGSIHGQDSDLCPEAFLMHLAALSNASVALAIHNQAKFLGKSLRAGGC